MLILLKLGVNRAREPRPLGLLPEFPKRWRAFLAGAAIDVAVLLACLYIPAPVRESDVHHYTVTRLVWPQEGRRLTAMLPLRPERLAAAISTNAPGPRPPRPVLGSPIGPPDLHHRWEMPSLPALSLPKVQAASRNPGGGTDQESTIRASRHEVQTGGRDTNGVAASRSVPPPGLAVPLSLDLPRGPGFGNGFAGRRGMPGILLSLGAGGGIGNGFGSGVGDGRGAAAPSSGGGDFSAREFDPLVILEKPRPAYTVEAKRERTEGEVVLDVVFAADGGVRVAGVVQSLGYGLDNAAIEAARRIRFSPARHNGVPYDVTAKLRIVFQLAY